jgi:hypothetical protein
MLYFNHESFLLRLKSKIANKYKLTERTIEGEPLRYKITGSSTDFTFLRFADVEGEVRVVLDFSAFAETTFIADVTKIVESITNNVDGG